ncbi:PREDICTED: zinc finger protein 580-like [Elephantulus edwardii]|uniref:zinc finger protein 580-like n=1 Tax=Elephantulus edwardii TaxID=28737 RepID=UPI0003F0D1CA|nr:PREDICTED: zinc finger protein 580-like [Elephantulus edwardii]
MTGHRSNPLLSPPLLPAAPQVMLLPPRPPALSSSPEPVDPPPSLRSSPEAMDPVTEPVSPSADPATSSPPHYYLLIDTHGVPYKYTAQRKDGRKADDEPPADGTEEEGGSCPCHECGRVCSSPMQLQRHFLTHSMVRPFTCDTCDRAFKRSSDLARHRRMAHNTVRRTGTDRPYVCPYCPRRFQDTATLAEHVPTH